jgi:hypothetical protein
MNIKLLTLAFVCLNGYQAVYAVETVKSCYGLGNVETCTTRDVGENDLKSTTCINTDDEGDQVCKTDTNNSVNNVANSD